MPRLANTKSAAFLCACMFLHVPAMSVFAAGAGDDRPAEACLRMEQHPVAFATAGCTKFVSLRNACDLPVVALIRRTQHLLSGTMQESIPIVVPSGGEQSLGCAWWSGALAPTQHELLAARFIAAPIRPPPREQDRSGRR
ncbi:MAG TPA: hypothetical protein VFG08_06020 [Candidatus Polarisedimenticolia bacterium]|nr:hypothetical protein [Candidatus Polarisedimenticolia bacterium]